MRTRERCGDAGRTGQPNSGSAASTEGYEFIHCSHNCSSMLSSLVTTSAAVNVEPGEHIVRFFVATHDLPRVVSQADRYDEVRKGARVSRIWMSSLNTSRQPAASCNSKYTESRIRTACTLRKFQPEIEGKRW